MNRWQCTLQLFSLILSVLVLHSTFATPIDVEVDQGRSIKSAISSSEQSEKLAVIINDVIADNVENTTQKVIRVNPLDLPAIAADTTNNNTEDSSLFKIKNIIPANRHYINSNHMRNTNKRTKDSAVTSLQPFDSPIIRQITEPKFRKSGSIEKKPLNIIYNQNALNEHNVNKAMHVQVTPGVYPIYYVISKTNGRFGKHPIKSFRTPTEFLKYLTKYKIAPRESDTKHLES